MVWVYRQPLYTVYSLTSSCRIRIPLASSSVYVIANPIVYCIPDVAAKCQILDGKSDEEKLHSMLNEEFWGVDVDEESGLVYGPFKHAFKCIAKYVAAAWKIRNAYAHPSDVA